MLRIAMLDDNIEDIKILQSYLLRYQEETNTKMKVFSYTSGLDFIETYETRYDVIFLDVEMPGIDGMEVAEEIRKRDDTVGIIFITNMAQYAIRGYEVNAIDFMVKPVGYYNFADKLRKAIKFAQLRTENEVFVNGEDGIIKLAESEIRYLVKEKNYLVFDTMKGNFRMRGTMQEMKEKLSKASFSECSSGCLVNFQYVEHIGKDTILVNQTKLPLSRRLKKEFTQNFIDYIGGI